jgi:hypothetical protein
MILQCAEYVQITEGAERICVHEKINVCSAPSPGLSGIPCWGGIMGKKKFSYGPTQGAGDSG